MVEFLRQWIINIVIVTIIIALLEAVLPNNSFKSYIKMIGGFLMIIVLLNPFIKLISKNISIDKEVFANIDRYKDMEVSQEVLSTGNENQIKDLYIGKLKNNIANSIKSKFNYGIKDIDIRLSEDEETYGEILGISIQVSSENENKNSDNKEIVIEEIKISSTDETKKGSKNINDNELKNYIHDEYKIPLENIEIKGD